MKLSDAMLLGMSTFKFEPRWWTCDGGGCLLGVAARAAGAKFYMGSDDLELIHGLWPWIDGAMVRVPAFAKNLVTFNEDPFNFVAEQRKSSPKAIISFLATHVKRGSVDLETVVEWVRQNEPLELSSETEQGVESLAAPAQPVAPGK